ncbi:MAG: adenylate/guanylate cyclase domain-containing protein [Arenicellales bacterium]|nr:adenylate/guanylate cyclase domain-containing protein [Arenicellales bacterium]
MNIVETPDTDRGNPLIDSLADWLVRQALRDTPLDKIYQDTCKQLYAAGIPVTRGRVAFRVLHPLFEAQSLHWELDKKVEATNYLHGAESEEVWRRSPLFHMITNKVPYLRRHLVGDAAIIDFPMLQELRDEGFTDYFSFVVWFDEDADIDSLARGIIGSWCTQRKNGFTNADIRSLIRIEQRLAVAFKINIQSQITENILSAYLGPGAGDRVLSGQIKRGDGENIHAVIWYSDMRDSTRLADSMSGQAFLEALNQYFESTAGAVLSHGGEVLRFIGDAVLAIFPIRGKSGAEKACQRAMKAAATARENLLIVNKERQASGKEPLDFGLGLHIGEVLFGNIGVPERVEFSVIGPAANEVARLESLTKSLQRGILVSESFAKHMKLDWVSEGQYTLRGVGQEVSVYAPPAVS